LSDEELPQFADAQTRFARIQSLVSSLRSLRQYAEVKPSVMLAGDLVETGTNWIGCAHLLRALAGVDLAASPSGAGISLPIEGATLSLFGLDAAALKPALEGQLATARSEVKRAEGKLANERFTSRAPAELVDEERGKVERFARDATQLEAVLAQL
jgi:valyl-tRNA synthetase